MSLIPVNLPHARTVAQRIEMRLGSVLGSGQYDTGNLESLLAEVLEILAPFDDFHDPGEGDSAVREEAASAARRLVDEIESLSVGNDRLGQAIRNLFECLGYAEEGAEISLRAGENPNSLMRPFKLV